MAQVTRGELVTITREVMDAEDSTRWSAGEVQRAINSVFDQEWSNILNAAPHYTLAQRTIATDAQGRFLLTALDSGSGDAQERCYRILSITDGNYLYRQTRFELVPLGTISNYLPQYPRLYYMSGRYVQVLPVGSGVSLYVTVNYKPTAVSDLADDDSIIDFPENSELLLAYGAGAQLLNKGGTESGPGRELSRMADSERSILLDDIRRRTINPTQMAYPDVIGDWAGM
jgi:hypothetical protein